MTSIAISARETVLVLDGVRFETTGRGRVKRAGWWIHPSLNDWAMLRGARFTVNRIKQEWTAKILDVARGIEPVRGPVVVTVTYFFPDDRRRDLDNYVPKFILDGLVEAGVIEGDDSETVFDLRTRIRIDPMNPRTRIKIEPVTDADLVEDDEVDADPRDEGAIRRTATIVESMKRRRSLRSIPGSSRIPRRPREGSE